MIFCSSNSSVTSFFLRDEKWFKVGTKDNVEVGYKIVCEMAGHKINALTNFELRKLSKTLVGR